MEDGASRGRLNKNGEGRKPLPSREGRSEHKEEKMSQGIISEKNRRLVDVRWFTSLEGAKAWIRSLGPEWKRWTEIDKPGYYRKAGWIVKLYEPTEGD